MIIQSQPSIQDYTLTLDCEIIDREDEITEIIFCTFIILRIK